MITRIDALKSIRDLFEGIPCFVTVGMAWVDWDRIRQSDGNFGLKTLGSGSSLGIGLALALPQRKVAIMDGDGAAIMNVNGLITVGRMQPKNLVHIVFDNKMYEASGCVPTASAVNVDLVAVAKGVGIRNASRVATVDSFKKVIENALKSAGPHFIVVNTAPATEDTGMTYARLDEIDNKFRFFRYLEALEGRKIREDAIDIKMSLR